MINFLIGDATMPKADGHKIIVHICNDIGGWGKGFVLALSKRWVYPEQKYREWYHSQGEQTAASKKYCLRLGDVQFIEVEADITVTNMVAQHDIRKINGISPIRYDALQDCLKTVCEKAQALTAASNAAVSIHMPRIGCGLAGGSWDKIEPIIESELCSNGIDVYVYDLN